MYRKPAFWLALLTLFVGALTFYRLGNTNTPVSTWTGNHPGQKIVVQFSRPNHLGRILLYNGIGKGTIEIESQNGNGPWTKVATDTQSAWTTNKWQAISTSVNTSAVEFVVKSGSVQLGEIGFFSSSGQLLKPISNGNNPLTDEQTTVPQHQTLQNSSYFDEVYYPADGYEYLHHMPIGEAVHPPFATEWMSLGILLFGNNPFGWRFFGAVFGVLLLPLLYYLGKLVFKNDWTAFFSVLAYALCGMNLVQSRVATLDVYAVFFGTLFVTMVFRYFEWKRKSDLYLSGLVLGLGIACKWNIGFLALGPLLWLCIDLVRSRNLRQVLHYVLALVLIPVVSYAATFVPVFGFASILPAAFWKLQLWMYSFQIGEREYAWFAEPWWGMLLDWKPYWYATETIGTKVTSISDLGNPMIWWGGLVALVSTTVVAVKRRDTSILWIAITVIGSVLPWVLITRLTYSYYYFVSIPLLAMVIVYSLRLLYRYAQVVFWVASLYTFVIFLPIWIGFPVTVQYLSHLKWFHTWYFY